MFTANTTGQVVFPVSARQEPRISLDGIEAVTAMKISNTWIRYDKMCACLWTEDSAAGCVFQTTAPARKHTCPVLQGGLQVLQVLQVKCIAELVIYELIVIVCQAMS
jgi:hypothetical protein